MDSKPLSYDSLKTILQYMEANKRFQIAQRIPSIRTADRVTPLFIDKLGFDGFDMIVNNTKYAVRTFIKNWKSPDGTIRYDSDDGHFRYDLDKYGLANFSTNELTTPGDLINRERRAVDNANYHETAMRDLESRLRHLKFNRDQSREDGERYEGRIKNRQAQLVPYYCSRCNRPFPYDIKLYLEFAYTSSSGYAKVELLSYNRTLPEAMKYLTAKFFGNRKCSIKVKLLENGWNDKTIRLPVDLKMEVRELLSMRMSGAIQLLPVIQNSKMEIFRLESPKENDFTIEALENAQLIIINCRALVNWLLFAQKLPNQQFLLLGTDTSGVSAEKYRRLMEHWIETGKEAGTCFSFGLFSSTADNVKGMVVEQFGGLTITMRNQCKLVVSFEEKPLERPKEYCGRWRMRMEVVQ